MSLRPPQESYQGIRSAWKGRPIRDFARGGGGWPLDLKFGAPLATVPSHSRRDAARRRRHEFGADRIADRCGEDAIDLRLGGRIEVPAAHLINRIQLAGMACAPQGRGDALIEHPANRQMDHSLVETLPGELIEPRHGGEILLEAWPLKFRIGAAKVVALEFAVWPHPSGQEAAAECAVAKGRDLVLLAIREDVGLDTALEQIIGRLQHMERRHPAEALHLLDREIADTDGADLALLEQGVHGLCGFLDRHQRVWPVNLVDVNVIGSKPTQ